MDLETTKSLVTGLVLAFALLQGLEMAQITGKVPTLLPFKKQTLRRWHRRGGILALVLTVAVALTCTLGEGFYTYPLRVWVHAGAGSLAILGMLTKALITHRARRLLRVNETLGGLIGLLILITFLASVVAYYL